MIKRGVSTERFENIRYYIRYLNRFVEGLHGHRPLSGQNVPASASQNVPASAGQNVPASAGSLVPIQSRFAPTQNKFVCRVFFKFAHKLMETDIFMGTDIVSYFVINIKVDSLDQS